MMNFGNRMKLYESFETNRRTKPLLPVIARLDGKTFSNFTKGLERPFDKRFSDLMIKVTEYLVSETNACMGYTQSDEITLAWFSDNIKSQIYFDGKLFKMISTLAAMASVKFNELLCDYLPEKKGQLPIFDCRVWDVPNLSEGANVFLWREMDATRNSILSAGYSMFSKTQMYKKKINKIQDMLFEKHINWNDYPAFFKRGTFVQKRTIKRKFTTDEIEKLPQQHDARKNPDLEIERQDIFVLDIPPFSKVTNREDVIFKGEYPAVEA